MYEDYKLNEYIVMSYRVEPIKRRVWDSVKEEVVELPEIYGYCVVDEKGETIGEGESRSDAMLAASEAILPKLSQV